jgi:hypothetical protein
MSRTRCAFQAPVEEAVDRRDRPDLETGLDRVVRSPADRIWPDGFGEGDQEHPRAAPADRLIELVEAAEHRQTATVLPRLKRVAVEGNRPASRRQPAPDHRAEPSIAPAAGAVGARGRG